MTTLDPNSTATTSTGYVNYDKLTTQAILDLQHRNGLASTGVIGDKEAYYLGKNYLAPATTALATQPINTNPETNGQYNLHPETDPRPTLNGTFNDPNPYIPPDVKNTITSSGGKSPLDLVNSIQTNNTTNSQPSAPAFSLTSGNLQSGAMNNANVKQLQSLLGITADGDFGPLTKAAVIAFQQKNGLTPDGIVGPQTAAALAKIGQTVKAPDDPSNKYNTTTGAPNPNYTGTAGGSSVTGTSTSARAEAAAQSVQAIKDSLAPKTPAPTPFDALATLDKLRKDQGLVNDTTELNTIQDAMRQAQEELNQFKQTSNKEISQGGFLGGVSEAERNMNFRLDSLSLREQAVIGRINTKNAYISQAVQAGQQTYDNAKTAYDEEYNKNLQATQLYNSEMDQQKQDALTGLTTTYNLLKDSGITTLTPTMKAQINDYENQLGIPTGTYEAALSSLPSGEKIINTVTTDNANGGKTVTFISQGSDGVPHIYKTISAGGSNSTGGSGGGSNTSNGYTVKSGDTYFALAQQNGTTVDALRTANPGINENNLQVGQTINIPGLNNMGTGNYSTIDLSRYSRAANAIVKNFIGLPQYNLTANGLPYLQRIQAADSIPGSVSDAELLDSIVKLNTGGNQVTEAQVKLITGGQSYSDILNVWKNKLGNGGVLSDAQRTQLTELANKVFDRYKADYQPIYQQATSQLKAAGIPEAFWTIPNLNKLSTQSSQSSNGGDDNSLLSQFGL